jgi:hypothetical protein
MAKIIVKKARSNNYVSKTGLLTPLFEIDNDD